MYLVRILTIMTLLLGLSGCVTVPIPFSKDRKQQVHRVAIAKEVAMPEDMYLWLSDMRLIAGGPQPVFIPQSSTGKANALVAKLQQRGISIQAIVREQLQQQLSAKNVFPLEKDEAKADAVLYIHIDLYGFSLRSGFGTKVYPVLRLYVELVKGKKILWRKGSYLTPLHPNAIGHSYADINYDPDLVLEMWQDASQSVISDIVKSLD